MTSAKVVVNEVMANEPGRSRNLEWIELYVDSSGPVSMHDHEIVVGDNSITLPETLVLEAQEHYIVCCKLVSTDGTASFERYWGDSSGVWGDTPLEATIRTPHEAKFSLKNDGGSVELYCAGRLLSGLAWTQSGKDGFSWERLSPKSEVIAQSVDFEGSTPGRVNSLTPVGHDLALEDIDARSDDGLTLIAFRLANRGLDLVADARLYLQFVADSVSGEPAEIVDILDIPALYPSDTASVSGVYVFDRLYVHLTAALVDDDRPRNNRLTFIAPGADFPPFILTEALANPTPGSNTEWVEIKNRLSRPFDLLGWQVGDPRNTYLITDTCLELAPEERMVLAMSRPDFEDYYHADELRTVQPHHWPRLRNDAGDTIRLVDQYGLEADRFEYLFTFDDNYTWCRGEQTGRENDWGRSEEQGGSPGNVNRVVFQQQTPTLSLDITPAIFSPNGDGFQDSAVITVAAPDLTHCELRIYDRQGRIIRRFNTDPYRSNSYAWNGCSDTGRRLPVGIYIVYCEVATVGSIKKPVVIAH